MDELSLGELVAVLTLGQDSSFGQPLESQMRSTLLAIWLAASAGLGTEVAGTAYWCAQLRYLGCTAHAHEVSVMFGDDIETRARTLAYDASNPATSPEPSGKRFLPPCLNPAAAPQRLSRRMVWHKRSTWLLSSRLLAM